MELKNSQMYNIDLKNTKEIYDFCLLNKIMDIDGFINKCFKKGFNIEKYGLIGEDSGKTLNDGEKRLINEVIREKRIEVPVEVIVEKIVEIIKEVPTPPTEVEVIKYVDREVIKEIKVEVPVEKIVYIYDKKEGEVEPIIVEKIVEVIKEVTIEPNNDKLLMLQETLNKLRKELTDKNSKITELEGTIKNLEQTNINQGAAYMKGSNLTNNI
jgi:hypothetical protein